MSFDVGEIVRKGDLRSDFDFTILVRHGACEDNGANPSHLRVDGLDDGLQDGSCIINGTNKQ